MHIGVGLVCGGKILDMVNAGFDFTVFLADWHAWINNKLGGDMSKIRIVGEYFKHCFTALGIAPDKVRYVWTSELAGDHSYWEKVILTAKNVTVSRARRALPIMGRSISAGEIEAAALIYPCMQVADIFHMDIDVACAGIDQRKAHMLAREIAPKFGLEKPVCIHTPLLADLEPQNQIKGKFDEDEKLSLKIGAKMSKSMPTRCIFIHDSPKEIRDKINLAFCPPREVEANPIMDIAKYVIFARLGKLTLDRPEKYGGSQTFNSFEELAEAYSKGTVHPLDLKNTVADALSEILLDVRKYFKSHEKILKKVMEFEVTR
ncbi:MAG: tyrosine--tRNA ligase [Candidatus Bathyarchaeia archaeon]